MHPSCRVKTLLKRAILNADLSCREDHTFMTKVCVKANIGQLRSHIDGSLWEWHVSSPQRSRATSQITEKVDFSLKKRIYIQKEHKRDRLFSFFAYFGQLFRDGKNISKSDNKHSSFQCLVNQNLNNYLRHKKVWQYLEIPIPTLTYFKHWTRFHRILTAKIPSKK